GLADLVDGVVPLAQGDDQLPGGRLLGLPLGPPRGGDKEGRRGVPAKLMAHHPEGPRRVAEGAGDGVRGVPLEEVGPQCLVGAGRAGAGGGVPLEKVGPQCLVGAVLGGARRLEEAPAGRYIFGCADRHVPMVVHTSPGTKNNRHPKAWGGPTPPGGRGSHPERHGGPPHREAPRHTPLSPNPPASAHPWPNRPANPFDALLLKSLDSRPRTAVASTAKGRVYVRQIPFRG